MTKEEREHLRALERAATPGDWHGDRNDGTVKYEITNTAGDVVLRSDNGNQSLANGDAHPYGFANEHDEMLTMALRNAAVPLLDAHEWAEQARGAMERYDDAHKLRLSSHVAMAEKKITREQWLVAGDQYGAAIDAFHRDVAALLTPTPKEPPRG